MKTSPLPEIEALRIEVHFLRDSATELEDRLTEFEGQDDDSWAIWPYCYVVSAWDARKTQRRPKNRPLANKCFRGRKGARFLRRAASFQTTRRQDGSHEPCREP